MDKDTNGEKSKVDHKQIQVCSEHPDVLLTERSQVQNRVYGTPGLL